MTVCKKYQFSNTIQILLAEKRQPENTIPSTIKLHIKKKKSGKKVLSSK